MLPVPPATAIVTIVLILLLGEDRKVLRREALLFPLYRIQFSGSSLGLIYLYSGDMLTAVLEHLAVAQAYENATQLHFTTSL